MQVIIVSSEIDRGGFEAPSVTFVPLNGWKNSTTMEQCNKWLQNPPYLSIEDCIERNTLNKSEVFNNIFLGLKKQKSVLGRKGLVVEGLINNFQRAKYFTVDLRDNVTPTFEEDEILFEILLSGNYDVFIHDPKFFTFTYMPMSVPIIWKALLVNETANYYYQMLMTEVKELDMAHDPCINDETYDFQVGHITQLAKSFQP